MSDPYSCPTARRGNRGFLRTLVRVVAPLSAAAVVAASCGGGSGGVSQTAPGPVEPMPPPCVETHDRGCVPESDYDALATGVAGDHAETTSFENQWGLAAIGADRAYANLELLPGLAARFPELKPNTVAVVAIGRDGGISDFSNRCGIAADYCLAAPGEEVAVAYYGRDGGVDGVRGTARASGTSLAAPFVTGGLALRKQLFRGQLSNTDLVARLLATADDGGVYADAAVYGRYRRGPAGDGQVGQARARHRRLRHPPAPRKGEEAAWQCATLSVHNRRTA